MTHSPISDATLATQLLAAHGVYALTIIVLFYVQWRAKKNLDTAQKVDHDYFRRCHATSVAASYALIIASSIVWVYATFFYGSSAHVHGSVINLTAQETEPKQPGDRPFIRQQISTAAHDLELYESKRGDEQTLGDGRYSLDWVVLPREGDAMKAIVLSFQHQYKILNASTKALPVNLTPNLLETQTLTQTFTLNLDALHYPRSIQIVYDPPTGDRIKALGALYLLQQGKRIDIPWDARPISRAIVHHSPFEIFRPFAVAFAAAPPYPSTVPGVFDSKGDYEPSVGRVLRERLGSPDLKVQLVAYDLLVDYRERSLKFIRDSLAVPAERNYDRQLLVHNLGRATEEIARGGVRIPAEQYVQLANEFVKLRDYESASRFFDKAPDGIRDSDTYFIRGFSYYQTEQCGKAVGDFQRYLGGKNSGTWKSDAHFRLGWCFGRMGRADEAIEEYRAALTLDPGAALAMNNLAYVYAEQGMKLDEALTLVSRALELEKDPSSTAEYKDTKGWILYKLGRYQEARDLIKQACDADAKNDVMRKHLEMVQRALAVTVGHK